MCKNRLDTPEGDMPIAGMAGLIAEPARAAILMALIDGRALPAGELADIARIMPQTASAHLSKLVEGNLLEVEKCGRHRYYRLAAEEVAQALETLAALSRRPQAKHAVSGEKQALSFARTCYDHLAGKLAVALAQSLVEKGLIDAQAAEFTVTAEGVAWFREFGVELEAIRNNNRAFARRCLDWTERRHHIAGALGSEILRHMLATGWIARIHGSRRVILTDIGRTELRERLGLRISGDSIHGYEEH